MTRPELTAVHVVGELAESCDAFRLTRLSLKGPSPAEFLLPADAATALRGFAAQRLAAGDGWLHLRTASGVVVSCRTVSATFPDISALLEVEGVRVALPKELAATLERCSIFTETEFTQDELVTIKAEDGRLEIEGRGPAGWVRERLVLADRKAAFSFSVNPKTLAEAAALCPEVVVSAARIGFFREGFAHVVRLK
jgi:hypothetical protein